MAADRQEARSAATCRGCGGPTKDTFVYCDDCYRKGGRTDSAASSRRCRGVLGWLLGHKFSKLGVLSQEGHCYRCGMPKGGWSK